jgi:hypothetical protein
MFAGHNFCSQCGGARRAFQRTPVALSDTNSPADDACHIRGSARLLITELPMPNDPWSRPTQEDLRRILDGIGRSETENARGFERLELSVPAELKTSRGNTVSAMTREISRTGIGLLHRGEISPGDVVVRMASESREFKYNVRIEWCTPCDNGMFMSGGRFLPSEPNR